MIGALGKAVHHVLAADTARPVVAGEATLTAGELLALSAGFGDALKAHGCHAGDRIVLCLQSNADMLIGMLGCWWIGASALQTDFRTPAPQRKAIAAALGAKLTVETRHPPGAEGYDHVVMDGSWRRHATIPDEALSTDAPAGAIALYSLSSGTTGTPKIYVQSHDLLVRRLTGIADRKKYTDGLFLTPMNMSTSATRNRILNTLLGGGSIHFMPPLFSVSELIETLSATRAISTALPPPVIARMVQEVGERPTPYFPDLAVLRSTGGPAPAEEKVAAYRYLTNGYRMAYSSNLTGTTTLLAGEDVLKRPETVGRTVAPVRVEIVDMASGEALPTGEAGLIKIYTPYLSDAVIQDDSGPEKGREERGPDWGIPGDIGVLDGEGFLTIVGRAADMIVRGGINVAPQEIEAILRRHPSVIDVAVAGMDDALYGQEIVAAIVARDGDEAAFHAYCMANIAPQKRPRIIRVVDALPFTSNGKLQRSKVAEMMSGKA